MFPSRKLLICWIVLLFLQPAIGLRAQDDDRHRLPPVGEGEVEEVLPAGEEIPRPPASPHATGGTAGDFPVLPPDPNEDEKDPLPPLDEELYNHGGSYLYAPEGDRWNWPDACDAHYDLLRLPEDWRKPRPVEHGAEYLGVGPIVTHPDLAWPSGVNGEGYRWEPRFVGYGSYQLFGLGFEENNRQQYGVGHQLLLELDLQLTGTERFHVQFRPVGRRNTGGSFYQFNAPAGYNSNATAVPDRYWFEGEIHSIFGAHLDPFAVADVHFVVGRFPFALHNNLLMNTDLLGAAVNKNTIFVGDLSNLNVQLFAGLENVAAYAGADGYVYGTHISADRRRVFYEATYAYLQHEFDSTRNAHFAALSRTQLYGPWTFATRAMFKLGDEGGSGDGQLLVLESNRTHYFDREPLGVKYGVFYGNAFVASDGWRPISGGGYDRLRSSFEVNPLVNISAGNPVGDNWGVSLGVQLFRHHEDESIIPEIAVQSPADELVYGFGLRYLRKTSARSFFEILGIVNVSDDPQYDRQGVFVGQTINF